MLMRFLLIGGSFSLGYAILNAGLVSLGAPPFATAILLYGLSIPMAYIAQKHFTFRASGCGRKSFFVYLCTQLGSFALVASVTLSFVSQVFWKDMSIYLATAALVAVVSFAVNKTFAFASHD